MLADEGEDSPASGIRPVPELRCDGLVAGDGWYEDGAICEDEPAGFPEEVYRALEIALRSSGPG